jgi:hypothetical protein
MLDQNAEMPREASNVILEGFTQLLLSALQVIGVTRMHMHALEVAGEDLPEVLPAIDNICWQMIQLVPSRVG